MPDKDFDIELRLLIDAIYLKYHYDFRGYAAASLKRRLRTAMGRFGCETLSQLQDQVLHDPVVFPALLDFLTVPVSEMFRDPTYFRSLRELVIPVLRTYPSLKIWVAGCGTGEEVYSLAILLREEGLLARTIIYATDINPDTLQKAEAGVYDVDRVAGFTDNHHKSGARSSLSDYYTAAYGRAVFDKSLKDHIVFSDHSLATDSVFAEVQLVSCRNVLIYFNRELQDRALGLFRDALCRNGFLGIGSKESLRFSSHASAFVEIVREDRIFQKRGQGRAMTVAASLQRRVDAIVIGTSAGGIEALSVLLPALRAGLRASILIVLHLPRERPSLLVDIFTPKCAVPVREADDKEPVEPGTVYFAPPDYHLLVDDGPRLALSADEPVNFSRPSIDLLFESAADIYGERLLGIILTGASRDGASGLEAVRRAGGATIVQQPESAQMSLMAEAALERTAVDFVLSLQQIAELLRTLDGRRAGDTPSSDGHKEGE